MSRRLLEYNAYACTPHMVILVVLGGLRHMVSFSRSMLALKAVPSYMRHAVCHYAGYVAFQGVPQVISHGKVASCAAAKESVH